MTSLRTRILVFVVLMLTVLSLTFCGIAYWKMRDAILYEINNEISQVVNNKISYITEWITVRENIVSAVLPRVGQGDIVPVLDQARVSGDFSDTYMGEPNKRMTKSTGTDPVPPGYDPTSRVWYQEASKTQEPIATKPYIDASTQRPVVTFAQGRYNSGQLAAVIGGDVFLEQVTKEVSSSKLPGNGYAFLITNTGEVIAHPVSDSGMKKIGDVIQGFDMSSVRQDGVLQRISLNGVETITGLYPVGDTGWLLGVIVPVDAATTALDDLMVLMIGVLIAGVLISGLLAYFSITHMFAGLIRLREAMKDVASGSGDLTMQLPVQTRDEVGQIAEAFNAFVRKLHGMFVSVRDDAEILAKDTNHLQQAADNIVADSQIQSEELSATAATIEEITVSINHIADHISATDSLVAGAHNNTVESYQVMDKVVHEVQSIVQTVELLQKAMSGLSSQSEKIRGIVTVIHEIADQTNLLALNAAIEAARAGEQGRGFAVVADEVRKLAERTTLATSEIAQMIDGVMRQTTEAIRHTDVTNERVTIGVSLAQDASEKMEQIRSSTDDIAIRMSEITASTKEQSVATTAMAQSAERVNAKALENDEHLQQILSTITGLTHRSDALRGLVSQFKL
ncbi:MAG: methyl-accepting chemotaxis protein [Azovibrio sp.]